MDQAAPRGATQTEESPLPPEALRRRVSGTADPGWFERSGLATLAEWRRALALAGASLEAAESIVDFGCGCGRVLRHLQPLLRPEQQLVGLDVDAEAIAWLQTALPRVRAALLRERPPAPLPSASVDLVLSHSVFTHLPETLQFAWLDEMARLLRPGGLLLVSLHGATAVDERLAGLRTAGRLEEAGRLETALRRQGFYYSAERLPAEEALPETYGLAYHDVGYVQRAWQESFDLLAWLPAFALGFQDLVMLRRTGDVPAQ